MQAEVDRDNSQKNKQIILTIAIYLLLTITNHYTSSHTLGNSLIKSIKDTNLPAPHPKSLLSIFDNENYEGVWISENKTDIDTALTKDRGKFIINVMRYGTNEKQKYDVTIRINNGYYIDKGNLLLNFRIIPQNWESIRNGSEVSLSPKNSNSNVASAEKPGEAIKVGYQHNLILQSIEDYPINPRHLQFVYTYNSKNNSLQIGLQIESQQLSVSLAIARQESNMLSTIIFATMLFFISYMQFSAIMRILKAIIEGEDQPLNYSLITVLISTMWDATLCLLAFIQAFRSEENLILFIMPAFLLCLLFTNLELRFILFIFQAHSDDNNIRSVVCKFNLLSYGSLILIYPIMYFTNLSTLFFISLSLFMLPQIYLNGINGRRPNLNNPFYKQFLTVRFLSIVIYIDNNLSFTLNAFLGIYFNCFTCLSLLSLQIFWLWLQKTYGPRRVLPKFLMPQSYDYSWKVEKTSEQLTDQCSICLAPLNSEQQNFSISFRAPFKLMKAPCGHKYHGSCLSEWMQVKMECPQCRSKLPAYE